MPLSYIKLVWHKQFSTLLYENQQKLQPFMNMAAISVYNSFIIENQFATRLLIRYAESVIGYTKTFVSYTAQ